MDVAQSTRKASSPFAAQADVAGVVASTVGKSSVSAVFARLYHGTKTDHVPRKLSKKRSVSDLKPLISAPLPIQRPTTAPTPSRASLIQPTASSQAKKDATNVTAALKPSRCPVPVSSSRVVPSKPQKACAAGPNQVRPAVPAPISAKTSDTAFRRSASSTPHAPRYALLRPDQPKAAANSLPSGIPRPSPSPVSKPSWPWAPHPNPLRCNPALALTVRPVPVTSLTVPKIMGRRYARRLSRMTCLPTLQESASENLPPTLHPELKAPAAERKSAAPMAPFRLPTRPAPPVNLPSHHQIQSQQLQARNDLMEAVDDLRMENTQLSSAVQNAVSQRIVAVTQLEQQKRDIQALEASLKSLWALVSPQTGLAEVSSTPQICEQIQLLSASATKPRPHPQRQQQTPPALVYLEQKLAQQTQEIALRRRSDAASRRMADTLIVENKQMKARLDQVEAERLRLRTSLNAAEAKLERVERSLYIYPTSAVQEMTKTHKTE